MKKIRWGIAGPGIIAHKFAEAVKKVEESELVGVASRSAERADAFSKEFDIPNVYSSYEEMAADSNIDVVYVSTAHPFHLSCSEVFLKAKKHVLCEKPMCVDAQSARQLAACAEQNGVFLMEAMWTAFLPAVMEIKRAIEDGVIGTPMGMNADFCYSIEREEDPKLFENSLAGGSLLDVGVYCLYFANLIFGKPTEIMAMSDIKNGVDHHTQMLLKYDNGGIAALSSAIKLEKPYDARIYGTGGEIYVPNFYKADSFTVKKNGGEKKVITYPYGDNGFEFEIREVCRCVAEQKRESDVLPLAKSIEVLEQMDGIRKCVGLSYDLKKL